MFPNPQSALQLPARPSLEFYRKLAKQLVKAAKSGDLSEGPLDEFARQRLAEKCTLSNAQYVIARSYGFKSWTKFLKHLEALAKASPVSRFEAAADAVVNGDADVLKTLLREDPKLARATSTREHGATLLHYVSANGVEHYRQKTPKNIVEITEMLLQAGAKIDSTADVYGGGCTALGLAATSVHPQRAGVQEALLRILLDHGADVELRSAGNRQSLVVACLANGRGKAAEFLADCGAALDFVAAAGIGRLDVVRTLIDETGPEQIDEGFFYACEYGRNAVVSFLLDRSVNLAGKRRDGQTPLHGAVIGGHIDTVRLLLKHRPPLEAENAYGGTAFGQALWSAAHGGDADIYIAILEALAAAGAAIPERHVPVNNRVDAWLAERGSVAEPKWYWFGEKGLSN